MQNILNKYYEFFIKSNFTTKDTSKDDKEFYELYKIITNRYDLSKDRDLKYDLMVFLIFLTLPVFLELEDLEFILLLAVVQIDKKQHLKEEKEYHLVGLMHLLIW